MQSNTSLPPTINPRWRPLIRALWVLAAVMVVGIILLALPGYFDWIIFGSLTGVEVASKGPLDTALNVVSLITSLGTALLCLALATLLHTRRSEDVMATYISFFLMLYGVVAAGPMEQLNWLIPNIGGFSVEILQPIFLGLPTMMIFTLFPTGRFVPSWSRWIFIPVTLLISLFTLRPFSEWMAVPGWQQAAIGIAWVLLIMFMIFAQIYRYRRVSGPAERQQTRWAMAGFILYLVMISLLSIPYVYLEGLPEGAPLPPWIRLTSSAWWLSMAIIPTFLTISILRFRLWDIDLIIQRTLSYAVITVLLAGTYYGGVIVLQTIFHRLTGNDSPLAVVASTLLIAALFNPLRQRVQTFIDRRFNRGKYDTQQTLDKFGEITRNEVNFEQIEYALLRAVEDTMQPESLSLWVKE